MQERWLFCLDSAPSNACVCLRSYKRDRAKGANETADECMCVGGLVKREPWRFYTASGSELLKAAGAAWMKSQYAQMKKKKNYTERGKQRPAETCWGAVDGPGCYSLQSNSFTRGNVHGSAVSPNEVLIDLNSWTTRARSEWCSRRPWVIRGCGC